MKDTRGEARRVAKRMVVGEPRPGGVWAWRGSGYG